MKLDAVERSSLTPVKSDPSRVLSGRRVGNWQMTSVNLVSQVLLALSVLATARLFAPATFGLFVAVDAVLQLVANIPALGLERRLASARDKGAYISTFRLSVTIAAVSPVMLVVPISASVIGSGVSWGRQMVSLVLLGVVVAAVRGLVFVLRFHSVVSGQLGVVVAIELSGAGLLLVGRVGFGLWLGTPEALLWAAAVAGVGTLVVVRLTGMQSMPAGMCGLASGGALPIARFAVPVASMTTETTIALLQRVPTHGLPLAVGLWFSPELAALVALASLMTFRPVSVVARASADLILALLASRRRNGRLSAVKGEMKRSVRMTALVSAALLGSIGCGVALLAAPILGGAWAGAAQMAVALIPLNFAAVVAIPINHSLTVLQATTVRMATSGLIAALTCVPVIVSSVVSPSPATTIMFSGAAATLVVAYQYRVACRMIEVA